MFSSQPKLQQIIYTDLHNVESVFLGGQQFRVYINRKRRKKEEMKLT